MWTIALVFSLLSVLIYYNLIRPHQYWKKKRVPYLRPMPFVGNLGSFIFERCSITEAINRLYEGQPNERYSGFYQFMQPALLIRDPQLIKQITVKNFDVFPVHKGFAPEALDTLWDKNLFSLRAGDKWRSMRSILSPSFTISKMKMLFPLVQNCAKQLSSHFLTSEGIQLAEMKDTMGRYANDVIAATSFGITCNSIKDEDSRLFNMGKSLFSFSGIKYLMFELYEICPAIMKLFKLEIVKQDVVAFFGKVINDIIKIREEMGIVKPDMIHLLMEAKTARMGCANKEIDADDILAQAIIFYLAGYDTSSTALSYVCYELALNPGIQERLSQEVKNCKGPVTYETLIGMKYLDMVVSESLRKWPSPDFADRVCMRSYTVQPQFPHETPLHIDAKTTIWIPIYAIHRDPKYYEDPDRFNPERFSPENKHKIQPYTYLPFGAGPRGCIGERFALLIIKVLLCELVTKFEIVPVEKTQIPLVFAKGSFGLVTEKGIWLGMVPRTQ